MKRFIGSLMVLLLLVSLKAQAATTVTVDGSDRVTVAQQPAGVVPVTVTPVVITREVLSGDFRGRIVEIDALRYQILVQDTNGRERRVQLKQGMIGTYKVGDYVRIHLMADLKEAKTIETIRGVRSLDGNIVSVDGSRSQVVVRGSDGKDSAVIIRQGQIDNYRVGDRVRIYLLDNREQVQVIRVIR